MTISIERHNGRIQLLVTTYAELASFFEQYPEMLKVDHWQHFSHAVLDKDPFTGRVTHHNRVYWTMTIPKDAPPALTFLLLQYENK